MHLELLEEEDGRRVSLEAEIEVEAAVQEAYSAVVAADHQLPSAAGATLNFSTDFLWDFAFPSSQFFLEELELPPLVHSPFSITDRLSDHCPKIKTPKTYSFFFKKLMIKLSTLKCFVFLVGKEGQMRTRF